MKKIMIAGGGTGGHILPALAVAENLRNRDVNVFFIGNNKSMEAALTANSGFDFYTINVQKLYRKFTFAHFLFPFKMIYSLCKCLKIIRKLKPDAFLGTGGFVSGPVGLAAIFTKTPVYLQEQNSYPGFTTRMLAKSAEKIFLGNPGAKDFFPPEKLIFSGNPVNPSIVNDTDKIDFKNLNLDPDSFKLFLIGGSQGSFILNHNLAAIIDHLLDANINIIWQTGKKAYPELAQEFGSRKGIYLFDFSFEIGKIYNSIDVAVARAGALTLAELETKKIPAVLIPLPSAAGNHQYFNALEMVNGGKALLLEQNKLNPKKLFRSIITLRDNFSQHKDKFQNAIHIEAASIISHSIIREMGD